MNLHASHGGGLDDKSAVKYIEKKMMMRELK
jgi:hypothetical protein